MAHKKIGKKRCPSCQHRWHMHSDNGCWFTVDQGHPGKSLGCPCRLPAPWFRDGADS